MENLTGHDNIVCEFALCIFNVLDRVMNSSGCSHEFNVVYVQWETVFVILQHIKYTHSRTKIKENH